MCDDCDYENVQLQAWLTEAYSQLETLENLMNGDPVSDFDLSFPLARRLSMYLEYICPGSRVRVVDGQHVDQCGWVNVVSQTISGRPDVTRYDVKLDSGQVISFGRDELIRMIP